MVNSEPCISQALDHVLVYQSQRKALQATLQIHDKRCNFFLFSLIAITIQEVTDSQN